MIDLDQPPPCYECGATVIVYEWVADGEPCYMWRCPERTCGCVSDAIERPSYRSAPATAALAAELDAARARISVLESALAQVTP
ncbi:MAG: hypothetical protein ACO3UW_11195 [Candidatus Nanopelagicales bacterium]